MSFTDALISKSVYYWQIDITLTLNVIAQNIV